MVIAAFQGMDFVWIALIVILLFGAKKIPELAKALGKAKREFSDAQSSFNQAVEEEARKPQEAPRKNIAPPAEEAEIKADTKVSSEKK